MKMPKLVGKKGSAGEAIVAGRLPGIEGDSPELERVVANSVSDAIRTGQGEGKAFIAGRTEFGKNPMGEATGRKRKQVPARAKQIGVLISLALLLTSMLGPGTTSAVMAESLAVIQHLTRERSKNTLRSE